MKIKNILIAGGGGELGVQLTDYIKNKDLNIFVIDKKFKKKINKKNIKFIKHDFLKSKSFKIPRNIDIVVFLIGITGGPLSLDFKYLNTYLQMNCETLIKFLKILEKKKIRKIIFTSTEHVYGDDFNNKKNILNIEPSPKNLYGITKLLSEKILHNFFKKTLISIDILRFPRVVCNNKNNLIIKLKNKAIKKNKIYLNNLNLKLNFLHISDFLSAIEKCIFQTSTKFRILNIFNNSKPISIKNLIKVIKQKLKIKLDIELINGKSIKNHNPQNLEISNKLSKKILKWKPMFNNSQIINEIIENNEIR